MQQGGVCHCIAIEWLHTNTDTQSYKNSHTHSHANTDTHNNTQSHKNTFMENWSPHTVTQTQTHKHVCAHTHMQGLVMWVEEPYNGSETSLQYIKIHVFDHLSFIAACLVWSHQGSIPGSLGRGTPPKQSAWPSEDTHVITHDRLFRDALPHIFRLREKHSRRTLMLFGCEVDQHTTSSCATEVKNRHL